MKATKTAPTFDSIDIALCRLEEDLDRYEDLDRRMREFAHQIIKDFTDQQGGEFRIPTMDQRDKNTTVQRVFIDKDKPCWIASLMCELWDFYGHDEKKYISDLPTEEQLSLVEYIKEFRQKENKTKTI